MSAEIQNDQTPALKKVFVDLWAHEKVLLKRRIVVEVPMDCDEEEVADTSGYTLDRLVNEQLCDASWEREGSEYFEVLDEVHVEGGVPKHIDADVTFVRHNSGNLVSVEPAN